LTPRPPSVTPLLLDQYRSLVQSGELQPDASQARAAAVLDALSRRLKRQPPGRRRWLARAKAAAEPSSQGVYLYGDVGRGKSFLMDLFFENVSVEKKRRVHFNAFMLETHQRLHEWRNLSDQERQASAEFVKDAGDDPIAPVAKRIISEAGLLAFDEFQVTDVADAMILGRLFEKLFALGGVIVATSNTPPDRLYEGGLNRSLFLPFIAEMKQRLEIVELNGPRDYRLDRMDGMKVYITPLNEAADAAMDAAWNRMTDSKGSQVTLDVLQRKLLVPQAAKGAARFSFDALCGQALGTADYLALARTFHTLFIDHIPRLGPEAHDEARRFTLLIDTLYDEKVKLVCSAAAAPAELYAGANDEDWFKRAASRLIEMQSADYLRLGHRTH
jgi:cell division protein ZapE